MGVGSRVHAAIAVALLPALALAPAVGGGVLAVWLVVGAARRPTGLRDAAVVVAASVALVAVWHGGEALTVAVAIAAGAALAWAVVRLDALASAGTSAWAGVGAAATAVALAVVAVGEAAPRGFAQVATATHHPNATAALALALALGSALAWRGNVASRFAGAVGVVAALALLLLSGSRGGLVGLAVALATLALVGVAALLGRVVGRRAATVVLASAALAPLIGLQALLMSPQAYAAWTTNGATPIDAPAFDLPDALADLPLVERLQRLRDPLGTSGGRLAAWKLAREIIAHRPLLGYGFGAVERVYAPGAASELSHPLSHPHHGLLTLVLECGTLLATALLALLAIVGLRLARAALRGDAVAAVGLAVLAGFVAMEMLDAVLRFGNTGGVALAALVLATADPDGARIGPAPRATTHASPRGRSVPS